MLPPETGARADERERGFVLRFQLSSLTRFVREDQEQESDKQQNTADAPSVEQDQRILKQLLPHEVIDPQDRLGIQQITQAENDQKETERSPQQEHIEKSTKIRRRSQRTGLAN